MCCMGRLENSDIVEGARRPMLLPKSDKIQAAYNRKSAQGM